MKVAVINTFDVRDITKWSGIPFHLSLFFDKQFGDNIDYISIPKLKRSFFSYLLGFYYNRIKRKKYYTWADERFLYNNKKLVDSYLKEDYKLVITFQFYLVPLLKKEFNKVICWNDGTFQNLYGFYSGYSNFSNYSYEAAHVIQKKALDLSDIIIYSSDWATESAASFYKTDKSKLRKILFASNFKTSISEDNVDGILMDRRNGSIILLFLTADWERKGGDDAVEVLNNLNNKGIKASLYVVGTDIPIRHRSNCNIIHYGFINKKSKEGEEQLVSLFIKSTFLIMPTRVDTTPVAFSEANSFALPVITTNIGAIPSVVNKNVNGVYFELSEFVNKATEYVIKFQPTSEQYNQLCHTSFVYHKENTSWHQVEDRFLQILRDLSFEY